jgi:hypothetical protein
LSYQAARVIYPPQSLVEDVSLELLLFSSYLSGGLGSSPLVGFEEPPGWKLANVTCLIFNNA